MAACAVVKFAALQWSFRGGTRGNAVPIVKIPLERMGTAFPLFSYGENAWERCCIVTKLPNTVPLGHKHIYILLKMHFAVQNDVFLNLKYGKTRWRPGLRPGPLWGSLRRSPRSPSRPGRRHPSPDPTTLSAFGSRYSAHSAPRISRLRRSILAFPLLLIYEMTTGSRPYAMDGIDILNSVEHW